MHYLRIYKITILLILVLTRIGTLWIETNRVYQKQKSKLHEPQYQTEGMPLSPTLRTKTSYTENIIPTIIRKVGETDPRFRRG